MTDEEKLLKRALEQEWERLDQEKEALREQQWRTRRTMMLHVAQRVDWRSDLQEMHAIERQLEGVREQWWQMHEKWLPLEEAEIVEQIRAEAEAEAAAEAEITRHLGNPMLDEEERQFWEERRAEFREEQAYRARIAAESAASMQKHREERERWFAEYMKEIKQLKEATND
jgi:hypothetical protein